MFVCLVVKSYFKQPGKHRVSVGHKLSLVLPPAGLVGQGRDHQTKGCQRSADGEIKIYLFIVEFKDTFNTKKVNYISVNKHFLRCVQFVVINDLISILHALWTQG